MSFQEKRILMNKFVESQFEVMYVYEFPTKENYFEDNFWVSDWSYLSLRVSKNLNPDEDICGRWVRSYVSLWVSNQSKFGSRHLWSLSLKLCKLMSFKQKRILMKTFVQSQFEVI